MNATISPLGIFCNGGNGWGSKSSQMGRTLCCFPSLAASITTSSTMKAAPRGGGLQIHLARILQILSLKDIITLVIQTYLQPLGGNQ